MSKTSITRLLIQKGLAEDSDRAMALLACRNVYVDGELCTDGRSLFRCDAKIDLVYGRYASRGGLKLEKAFDCFEIDVSGLVAVDAGASTGGFTDCLLQRGSRVVHAVDVGFNQLSYRLRTDPKVIVHEKTNIMALSLQDLDPPPDIATADLSFRSISGAASHILSLTTQKILIALVKPQFEVPKGAENFSGVVLDDDLMRETLCGVWRALESEGAGIFNACESPILGRKGNREYLVLIRPKTLGARDALSLTEFLLKCGIEDCGSV